MIALQRAVWCLSVALGAALDVALPALAAVALMVAASLAGQTAVLVALEHQRGLSR